MQPLSPLVPFCPFPCILLTRWQSDLLEMQVWSCCLPAETCQGFPIALKKRPDYSPCSLKPSWCVPRPPWISTRKLPQAPPAVHAAAIPTLVLECAGLPSATGPLHMLCSPSGALPPNLPPQRVDVSIYTSIAFQESLP